MKLTSILARTVAALCVFSGAQLAAAQYYQGGSYTVRVGASYVDPDDPSASLVFDGVLAPDFFDTSFDVDEDTTWNISGVWMPVDHWGVELMYIDSAEHDLDIDRFAGFAGAGTLALGEFDASLSNLFLNWFFLDPSCLGQPYVGLGVNYIDFGGERLSDGANRFLVDSGLAADRGRLGLGHSWGLAAQIGVDFRFSRDSAWVGNAALMYIDADTDFNIRYPVESFAVPNHLFTEDFQYDPWIFNLGVGYTFSF